MTPTACTFEPHEGLTLRDYVPKHRRRVTEPQHRRRKPSMLRRPVTMTLPIVALGVAAFGSVKGGHRGTRIDATLAASTRAATPATVTGYGGAPALGAPSTAGRVASITPTPSGNGYWVADSAGGVSAYGDAADHGSMAGAALASPIVGMAATPDGGGYWLVASDGGVFAFGDAGYFGSLGGTHLRRPVVGLAASPSGRGYALAAADGGVFTFGDAAFVGSLAGSHLDSPIVGIASAPTGSGYWLVASDGGVFCLGDATFHGSMASSASSDSVVGIATTRAGDGYWLATASGAVHGYGGALVSEAATGARPGVTTAMARAGDDHSYWLVGQPAAAASPSGSSGTGTPLGAFTVTCYDDHGTTASGAHTSMQTVAVDPSVIPMGTHIYIDGVGERIAQDTGGAVRGRHVDIWEPSAATCNQWGVQTREVSRL